MDKHGHQAIMYDAAYRLFDTLVPSGGHLMGLDKEQFVSAMVDRITYADRVEGPTWLPWFFAPDAQAFHSLANPLISGEQNIAKIANYAISELDKARECHFKNDVRGELTHLGNALHTVQDSYSYGHTVRDIYDLGNPHAAITALFVFDSLVLTNTHEARFDQVAVAGHQLERPGDQAASKGSSETMSHFLHSLTLSGSDGHREIANTIHALIHGPAHDHVTVVTVSHHNVVQHFHALATANERCWRDGSDGSRTHTTNTTDAAASHPFFHQHSFDQRLDGLLHQADGDAQSTHTHMNTSHEAAQHAATHAAHHSSTEQSAGHQHSAHHHSNHEHAPAHGHHPVHHHPDAPHHSSHTAHHAPHAHPEHFTVHIHTPPHF